MGKKRQAMYSRYIWPLIVFLLCDARKSEAMIYFFTTYAYVRPPATTSVIKLYADVLKHEAAGEYDKGLASKLELRKELLTVQPPDLVALKHLNDEIVSLKRYLSLSQQERDEFIKAISYVVQAAGHIHYDNRPEMILVLEKNAACVRRLCGDEYVQNDRIANIIIAARCVFRQYVSALDEINRLQQRNPAIDGQWPPESIRAEYLRSWILAQLRDAPSSRTAFDLALKQHKASSADADRRGLDDDLFLLDFLDLTDMLFTHGDFAEAARGRAIQEEIAVTIYGADSQRYAYSLIASASILFEAGNASLASNKAVAAMALAKKLHTDGDRFLPDVLNRGGMLLYDAGDYANALDALSSAYREYDNLKDDEGKFNALVYTSYLKSKTNDKTGADQASLQALELSARLPDDVDVQITALKCRANALNEAGDVVAAVGLISTAIETNRAASGHHPNGSPKTAELLEDRSTLLKKLGDVDGARRDLEAARDILIKTVGASHRQTTTVTAKLKNIGK